MVTALLVTQSDHISPSETLASATHVCPLVVASGGTQFKSL